jgi:ATP synthase protein I
MTTESKQDTRQGRSVLLGAAGAALVAGLAMALAAWLLADATAVRSVLASTLLVVVVIGFGVFVLNTVASVMPGATVLVALVTYALQLVVMAAVVLQLVRSGMMADTLDRRWFGGGVAVATLAWMVAQIVAATKARIPLYDLPEAGA